MTDAFITTKDVNQKQVLETGQEPDRVLINDNFEKHNISQNSCCNNLQILKADDSESVRNQIEESFSNSTISFYKDGFQIQVKEECIENLESPCNHNKDFVSMTENIDEERRPITAKEGMNLNELVIESEDIPKNLKSAPKRRGRPKGKSSNKSSPTKSKKTFQNKEEQVCDNKRKSTGNKALCTDPSKKNSKTNKFKGAKEMRVEISRLKDSVGDVNEYGGLQKSSKNIANCKSNSKRKKGSQICKESNLQKKRKARAEFSFETDINIKQELESSEDDNFDNDPDYFPVKEEAESPVLGRRKKHRIGRPPKIGDNPCKKCEASFPTKRLLIAHQKVHAIPKQSCRFCDFEAKSVVVMMEHEAKHTHEKPFKCDHPDCDYASRSNVDLQRHKSKHSTEKKYKCPYENCDFVTKWQRNIRHHVLRHTDERPYPCHLCIQSFKRVQDLKYHLYRHNDNKPIACDECDFRCKTNFELKCHKLKHSDVRNYACTHPGCTQRTKSKSDLTKHMKIHTNQKDYICDECGKGFRTRACLSKHLQRHSDIRPFSCDICNRAFKVKVALRKHVALHSEYRPYSCEMCGQKFSSKSNKNVHMKTHDYSDRPYPCPVCPYAAKIQGHLLSHIGSMHGNSYAYFCEACKKPFKRYGQLKVHHVRMHPEVDFGKLKTENHIRQRNSDDVTLTNYAFDEDTIAGVEECINSVVSKTREAMEIKEENELPSELREAKIKEDFACLATAVEGKELEDAANAHIIKEKRKRGRPKKNKPSVQIQQLKVKQGDMRVQSDIEKLHENLILSEKLSIAAGNDDVKDVKDDSILENLNTDVTLTPLTHDERTEDVQGSENSKNEDSTQAPATLTIYEGGFRLPLATKGFKFNFDKTGKKPKSWFMNPDNMHKGAREHQMKYLARKDTEYKYYLRAHRKKLVGRNKVLESLERRRKSAAKRFATGASSFVKRCHGKAPFRFTKVVEEDGNVGDTQQQSRSAASSLLDDIPGQTLPKLIFKKKPDQQEEYECIQKEESKVDMQSESRENKERNDVEDDKKKEPLRNYSSVETIEESKKGNVQSNIRVCFKKRGRPKTKNKEKSDLKNPTKTPQWKKGQTKKKSQLKDKKSDSKKSNLQSKSKNKKVVRESQGNSKVKKKGRPKKSELENCVQKKCKISQETGVAPSKRGGRKKAQDVNTGKQSAVGKGKRGRRSKGDFVIEWETGDQEASVIIKNEEVNSEMSVTEPEISSVPEGNVSTDVLLPERLTVVDNTTMETVTSIKIEPQEQASHHGDCYNGNHDLTDAPFKLEGRVPDDLLVMKDYVNDLV
ncbi:protein suppressor of hairy wing-like [Saccostrea echinata]|uniref:protein suppressor of hairy wing-like n=1 Tax=Saccostrea echinata TaxID=191078 RepID=UPI002A831F7B|nr:protein suppressor of hairy wing-like [Saccostrea echinata]